MEQKRRKKKFFALHRQVQVLIGVAIVVIVAACILVRLSRDPIYAYAGVKPTYDASDEIAAAKERLSADEAELITKSGSTEHKVLLIFENVASEEVMRHITDTLLKYDMDAIFFASAVDAVENADAMRLIISRGFRIGGYNLKGEANMQQLASDELLDVFCTSGLIIKSVTGV